MRHITLTLHQPYALFVVFGIETIRDPKLDDQDTRTLRIHASKRPMTEDNLRDLSFLIHEFHLESLCNYGQPLWELGHNPLLFGSVIGDVFLEGCYSTNITELTDRLSTMEKLVGDYRPNRYFMPITRHNFYVNPTPARGLQRFWYWDDTGADCRAREAIQWQT